MGHWFERDLKVHHKWKALISIGTRQSQEPKKPAGNTQIAKFLLQMSEVLVSFMANGRDLQRLLCPVSPRWHTQAQMEAYISHQQKQTKAVGRLLGLEAQDQKLQLWVVNVYLEKEEIQKRGNPWFWGCGVMWSQVVTASGSLVQFVSMSRTSPRLLQKEQEKGHLPVGEGKSTHRSS